MAGLAVGSNGIFDGLANSISEAERNDILSQLKSDDLEVSGGKRFRKTDVKTALLLKYRQLSFFQRLIIRIKSFFSGSSVESVVNEALVASVARRIELHTPLLIQYRKRILCELFYEKIQLLRASVDFFQPYLDAFDRNPAAVYKIAGSVIVPEIEQEIQKKLDLSEVGLDEDVTPEMKRKLLESLLATIEEIPSGARKDMERSIKGILWLNRLRKVPLGKMAAKFMQLENGGQECPFSFIKSSILPLAKVMRQMVTLDDTIVDIFRELPVEEPFLLNDARYKTAVGSQLPAIRMFCASMPMQDLVKVIYGDAMFEVESESFAVDWFGLYRKEWSRVFERKLAEWEDGHKRKQLRAKLLQYFAMPNFPQFPYRPWENAGKGLVFHYEASLGLIHDFFERHFERYTKLFRILLQEGEYASRENRQEFNLAADEFTKVNARLEQFSAPLAGNGGYAADFSVFRNIQAPTRSLVHKMEQELLAIEHDFLDLQKAFDLMSCRMINLLGGFLSNRGFGRYCMVSNLQQLFSVDFDFLPELKDCNTEFHRMYEILKDVEALESAQKERG